MSGRNLFRGNVGAPGCLKVGDVIDLGSGDGWARPAQSAEAELIDDDAIWAVVQSEHRQERKARDELERIGIRMFLPTYQAKVKRSKGVTIKQRGKFELVDKVLFPGYLFMRTSVASGNWKRAFSCKGVRGVICMGDRPSPVPDVKVAAIMALPNCGIAMDTPDLPFAPGAKVRIDEGPFVGFEALVEEIKCGQVDEATAVNVLLSLFGRECRITLSAGSLSRLDPSG